MCVHESLLMHYFHSVLSLWDKVNADIGNPYILYISTGLQNDLLMNITTCVAAILKSWFPAIWEKKIPVLFLDLCSIFQDLFLAQWYSSTEPYVNGQKDDTRHIIVWPTFVGHIKMIHFNPSMDMWLHLSIPKFQGCNCWSSVMNK